MADDSSDKYIYYNGRRYTTNTNVTTETNFDSTRTIVQNTAQHLGSTYPARPERTTSLSSQGVALDDLFDELAEEEEDGEDEPVEPTSPVRKRKRVDGGSSRDCDWPQERMSEQELMNIKQSWKFVEKNNLQWTPRLSPWDDDLERLRQEEEEVNPNYCWGCTYEDTRIGTIFSERWNTMMDLFKNGLKAGKLYTLTMEIYKYFVSHVLLNPKDAVTMGVSPYSLMRHLLFHNKDPEIRIFVLLSRVQAITDKHVSENMIEEHVTTGHERVIADSIAVLDKLIKLEMCLMKSNPDKMLFRNKSRKLPQGNYPLINAKAHPMTHTVVHNTMFREYAL